MVEEREAAKQDPAELEAKRLREQFSDYEKAVTFISSLENWFHYRWGSGGRVAPGLLREFDRFPKLGDLTPDFVARFGTPYLLCGEHMAGFRQGKAGAADVDQIVAYSRYTPSPDENGRVPGFDVLVLVHWLTDDVAVSALEDARKRADPEKRPRAPVVVIGFDRSHPEDREREWYDLKWRDAPGNCRFSTPNVSSDRTVADLNDLLTKRTHHSVPVDTSALDVAGRSLFINDEPPPQYTAVRLVVPALNELLTEHERDTLYAGGRVVRQVSVQEVRQTSVGERTGVTPGRVRKALEFMVIAGLARRVKTESGHKYAVSLSLRLLQQDLQNTLSQRAAKSIVRKRQRQRDDAHRADSEPEESSRQLSLEFDKDE